MQQKPRHRLATDAALKTGATVTLEGNAAHYLTHVLRMGAGDAVALFNRTDGEWSAAIAEVKKKSLTLQVNAQTKAPAHGVDFWVCFAPIKGGRLETIIEKSTELGAAMLQPVVTQRTIVDKVNTERAESIAREAAEQCERTDWPEIRDVKKFAAWLGDFPEDRVLIYGDETGQGVAITVLTQGTRVAEGEPPREGGQERSDEGGGLAHPFRAAGATKKWAILAGPEGGFTPDELAMLRHKKNAQAVSLGPRILRADTAIITLAAITLSAWGDWHHPPRFEGATA
jgi:16S rRNA (uracil1498-N3)-methyltransferase